MYLITQSLLEGTKEGKGNTDFQIDLFALKNTISNMTSVFKTV